MDVDQDSYTDILLVGAPMYMGPEREEQGKVYVFKLNEVCGVLFVSLTCHSKLSSMKIHFREGQ